MKTFRELLARNPLLDICLFNFIFTSIMIGIGFLISYFFKYQIGLVVFLESMLVLVICYSSFNGNANSRSSFGVSDRKIMGEHDYYLGAYHFIIKLGISGVLLFIASGVLGMK